MNRVHRITSMGVFSWFFVKFSLGFNKRYHHIPTKQTWHVKSKHSQNSNINNNHHHYKHNHVDSNPLFLEQMRVDRKQVQKSMKNEQIEWTFNSNRPATESNMWRKHNYNEEKIK